MIWIILWNGLNYNEVAVVNIDIGNYKTNKVNNNLGGAFVVVILLPKCMGRKRPTKYFPYKKYGLKSTHEVQCGGVVFKSRKSYLTPKSKY